MNATAIAINYLYDPKASQGLAKLDRLEYLATRLHGFTDELHAEYLEGKRKYEELLRHLESTKARGAQNLILENWRVGNVNKGTNSVTGLSLLLDNCIKALPVKKVIIPAVPSKKEFDEAKKLETPSGPYVLDLYNKGDERVPYPGLAPRAQAVFWGLVAHNKEILGFFGGRSGSVDIAAFCGVRVLFWDERFIDYASGEGEVIKPKFKDANAGESKPGIDKSAEKDVVSQIGQCLRSLQLAALMSIGMPTLVDGEYTELRDNVMQRWIEAICSSHESRPRLHPTAPKFGTWKLANSINDYRLAVVDRYNDMDFKSRILDDMGYEGNQRGQDLPGQNFRYNDLNGSIREYRDEEARLAKELEMKAEEKRQAKEKTEQEKQAKITELRRVAEEKKQKAAADKEKKELGETSKNNK